ncbi:MAG: hypothetical protein CL887_03900 [Dehalococcoidia bacterium]|nr:hypothetical protein [Dehalococcoidia bacterium]|tara:strand:- start:2156 stop:2593 length:438 start_codon:yes stop_codon:yes gene_type:complete
MPTLRNQSRALLGSKNATMTNPRLVVLDLLIKEARPLTIDQVLKLSKGKLAQSTLYRVINDLTAFDLITEFTTPENTMVIELNSEDNNHHHHIFCKKCGSITDIELNDSLEAALEKEVSKIEKYRSIAIDSHSLELYGTCDDCTN